MLLSESYSLKSPSIAKQLKVAVGFLGFLNGFSCEKATEGLGKCWSYAYHHHGFCELNYIKEDKEPVVR